MEPLLWAQPISRQRGRGSTYPFLAGLRHACGVVVRQLKEVLHACHALSLPLPAAHDAVQLVCGEGRTRPPALLRDGWGVEIHEFKLFLRLPCQTFALRVTNAISRLSIVENLYLYSG